MPTQMEDVTREIVRAADERKRFLVELSEATVALLDEASSARHEMSVALRARLARDRVALTHMTHMQLSRLATERQTRVRQQWRQLINAERARRRAGRARAQELAATAAERRSHVRVAVHRLHDERVREERAWTRGVAAVRGATHERGSTHRQPTEKPERDVPRQTARQRPDDPGEASRVLADRVLAHLAGRTEGARLTDIAEHFEVAPIRMAGLLKRLVDAGRVDQRDGGYAARVR